MLKNYFKIAWRNIIKSRFYSAVNIIGLSTGIAFTLLIGAYVWSELQVNKGLKNADRQYILQSKWKDPNQGIDFSFCVDSWFYNFLINICSNNKSGAG